MEWDNFKVWETNEGTVAGIQVRDSGNLSLGNGCEEKMTGLRVLEVTK